MHQNHPINDYAATLTEGAQLVDVREPDEVAEGSLPGAVNIPVGALADRLDELDSSHRVVVFCRSGGRSTMAAELLAVNDFTDVVNLEGGMLAYEG